MKSSEIGKWKDENMEKVRDALSMAWPSVLESFFVALASMIDTMMVGSMGATAVAAVGLTTQPKYVGMCIFIAVNVAVSALVARRRGEKDRHGANQVLLTALAFTLVAGAIISVVCVVYADLFMELCGSEPETHDWAVCYFQIIMGGMLFNIISLTINAAQRGSGNTRIAMVTNVTSNILNIIGNYLLIGGHFGFPALGIQGAAIATVFGTVAACAMSVASLLRKNSFVQLGFILKNRIRIALKPVKAIASLSSGVALEQLLMRIGFMSTALMTAKLGTAAFAAHQVGMNVLNVSFSLGDGMQAAAVALIGRSLGEEKPELAKSYGRICQLIGTVIALVTAAFFLIFGRWICRLYFTEPHIVEIGVMLMRIIAVIIIFQISAVIYTGCLRGAGDVIFTMAASTLSVTVIRTLVSYVMCFVVGWGIYGIWMGILADQLSRGVLTSLRFKSGVWTRIKI